MAIPEIAENLKEPDVINNDNDLYKNIKNQEEGVKESTSFMMKYMFRKEYKKPADTIKD